jgi:hypothetical protein
MGRFEMRTPSLFAQVLFIDSSGSKAILMAKYANGFREGEPVLSKAILTPGDRKRLLETITTEVTPLLTEHERHWLGWGTAEISVAEKLLDLRDRIRARDAKRIRSGKDEGSLY